MFALTKAIAQLSNETEKLMFVLTRAIAQLTNESETGQLMLALFFGI